MCVCVVCVCVCVFVCVCVCVCVCVYIQSNDLFPHSPLLNHNGWVLTIWWVGNLESHPYSAQHRCIY